MKFFNYRELLWVGSGGDTSPDYIGPIVSEHYIEDVKEIICEVFYDLGKWDYLKLNDMPSSLAEWFNSLRSSNNKLGLKELDAKEYEISKCVLPDNWEQYLRLLSANRRQQIRRFRRKMQTRDVSYEILCDISQLRNWFNDLAKLHHKRWDQKQEEHSFSSDSYNDFHYSMMEYLLEKKQLRLWKLSIDNEATAMLYCLREQGITYYVQGGFDTEHAVYKPGMVLMSVAIEKAIEEGCNEFNMLKGNYEFKHSFAKEKDVNVSISAYRPGIVPMIYRFRFELLPKLKQMLRSKQSLLRKFGLSLLFAKIQ